ncbi:MAG: ethanolamine utilization protein EutH [Faecousia sp.]
MNQIIMYIMAFGAVLGGVDYILGNRFGYGARFEEAFRLLGSIAFSMAGILCLAPLLAQWIGKLVVPLFSVVGLDPAMFGCILAIDMGGYPIAMELALDPAVGRFSGIIAAAIFGCTLVFTIPVGLGAMGEADRPSFLRGVFIGLMVMPGGILAGGLVSGLPFLCILWQSLPIELACGFLLLGFLRKPDTMICLFQRFAGGIRALAGLGLMLGAVAYMTGVELPEGMLSLPDAMSVACSIAIVMLGSMPLAELLQRLCRVPFAWLGKHTGMNGVSTTGLLMSLVSVTPVLAMVPRMDTRGKVVTGAFVVSSTSVFSAHLSYTLTAEPDMVPALLTAKLIGAFLGAAAALIIEPFSARRGNE